MEWRYYGVRLTGLRKTGPHSPEKFVQRLATSIQGRRCAQQLPAIRCSPLLGRDAYVFLAHLEEPEDPPSGVPDLIQSVFGDARHVGTIIVPHDHRGGFALEEIRRFTGPNLTTDTVGSLRNLFCLPALAEITPYTLDL